MLPVLVPRLNKPLSVTPSLLHCALTMRCPRCGQGKLFNGLLTITDRCESCGLDLTAQQTGDGPVVLVMLLLGTILVIAAFWVEFHLEPPLWVHAVLWPAVGLPLALAMMRPLKALFVAIQYRHISTGA
jgi:uncharacterized protein (DUF983 family)